MRNWMPAFLLAAVFALPAHAADGGLEDLRQTGKAFAGVARDVSPAVVYIQAEGRAADTAVSGFSLPFGDDSPFGDELFRRFFGERFPGLPRAQPETPRGERRQVGQGSGFVFASGDEAHAGKTFILTNNHVVEGAEKIRVRLQDGREFDAEITGRDPQSDVAVIEIAAGDVPDLAWGDSSALEVGEWVIAIGNPFGLNHSLTVGVVSAKGRTTVGINDYEDFIQTDAAINPGNSGGPLVNLDGQVVGINTAIFSRSGGYMGVGFAIPSNLARSVANQLIEHGEVTRGYLGVLVQQLTSDLAASFDIEPGQGILVAQVTEDSPAARAGLRQGDVIVGFQGEAVTEVGRFRNRVSLTRPGSRAAVEVLRDGRRKTLDVTIGKLGEAERVAAAGPVSSSDEIGLTVQTLTPQLAEQLDTPPGTGVVVTEVRPGSVAARAGLERGAVILQANRRPLKDAADFAQAVEQSAQDKRLLLLVREGGAQRFVVLNW